MAVNDVTIFRDPDTGDVGLKDKSSGNKFLWSSDRQEWFLEDSSGERPVGGSKGAQTVSVTDYSIETKDGDRRLLVETSDDIRLEDTKTDTDITDSFIGIDVNPNNSYVAISDNSGDSFAGKTGNVFVYDLSTLSLVEKFKMPTEFDNAGEVSWSSFNELVVTSLDEEGKAYLYDENFSVIQMLDDPTDTVYSVDFDNSDRIALGSRDSNVYIYTRNNSTGQYEFDTTLNDPGSKVVGVSWDESSGRLGVIDDGDNLTVYNSSLSVIDTKSLTNINSFYGDVEWRKDGYLAVGQDSKTSVFDDTLTLVTDISVGLRIIDGVSFSSDKKLAIGSEDSNVYVYDSQFNLIQTLNDTSDPITVCEWNPNSDTQLVTGASDFNIRFYDVVRNRVDIASDNPDYFETTIVNSGDWIVEIESTDATLNSLVGSEPKIIDHWGEAVVKKTGSSEYLVEGDIYKETGDGFTQSL